ncbi:outer membrane beta-barrel protein [Helicobacter ailurogastricus]|uniref:outer membrane beta-barrel protein n=1 Tax=Helicobacter ailurogastricus TaxID=1578720 RepID=UPI00255754CB|nr:outer membrane beta-barrel protein [Helicobacter ailurogastricus]
MSGINMSFKPLVLCFCAVCVLGARSAIQEKQFTIYMLKGQLYEAKQAQLDKKMAKKKSGVFLGFVLAETNLKVNGITNKGFPLLYGVRVGYQKYLGRSEVGGLRFYGEYLGGVAQSVLQAGQTSSYQVATMNLDLVMDKPIDEHKKYAVGVFGGLGVGWNGYKDYPNAKNNPNGFGLLVNLGVALTLNTRHRIELALKIPPLKYSHAFSYSFAGGNIYYISYNFLL